ncbi:MAG TPA: PQQ-binding-like beta-propeller repeat protein, partial [Gemmataceae bacterium]|nr:PQQ-binding-like beta-propeller repeat protein [Gemmataceae bacterium]
QVGQPVVPAFFPVAATVQSDTGPTPLLIYRSYWGVHAVELKTGKLYWESILPSGMDVLVKDSQKMGVLNQWWNFYQQLNSQSILFENSTLGMISTDGTSVYAVDDLALPPHPNWLQQFQWGNGPQFGPLESAVKQSKLVAVELDSGKLLWEQGGPDGDQELAESFFLGPPLPLGGKLYVLNEKRTELRLLCLDPRRKGAVSWSQTLANIRDGLDKDVSRRMSAANLAYGEGILVCPTNAGAILGVDVLTHSLVWAQPYRKPNGSAPDPNNMGMIRRWGGNPYAGQPLSPDWKVTAPVIQDGKVVLAAPDGHAVECLNLRTGTPLWTANKLDDVYVGGVYNGKVLLVGKGACRALSLADGKQLWREQTGLPSGQGVASNNVYYLPLKSGITSKLPEVCAIDVNTGHIIGHSKSRPDHDGKRPVPGNLLFFEGDVLSQSVDTVTAYQQLQVKLDQITERLKANPTDPVGLTERGEMKLDKGDLEGAAADLHTALANKPPAEVLPKTRSKLFDTLTELLKKDFDKNEQYLKEYEGLCKVPIPPDVEEADKQKLVEEEQQRMANFLGLTAKGREKQGKLVEAFDAYMKFGSLGGNRELVPSVDDATIKARPDVWAQGRIAAMIAKATPQQRQPLEDQINEQWKKVRMAKGTDELRRFVSVFGTHFRVGKEAQLRLAERRMDEQGGFLEAEMLLLQLRRQGEPALAGQAVDALARLMIRKELMDDAAWYYRILARDFAHTVVRDGKTGADIYNDLATDKRFLPYLDDPQQAWIGGKMKAKEITGTFPQQWQMFNFEPEGDVLPFFQRNQLSLVNNSQVKLTDSHTGEERFLSQNLNNVNTQYLYNNGYPSARFPYQVEGHLLVLNLGHMVYAFDPIDKKLLWERNLFGSGAPNPNQGQQVIPDRDGGLEVVYPEGFRMRLGKPGPVRASYVCLLTRQGLEARDPISGTVLWTKTNTSPRSQIFGDEEHVYLLEGRDNNETVGAGQALRARDGATVENVPDFSNPWQHRIRTLGSKLLVSETDPEAGLVLRLYDVYTGKDVWKRTFSAKARVIRTEDDELTGVVEPDKDGKVTVIDLHTRKEVLVTRIDPAKLEKVAEDGVHLLRDNDHYYLTINAPFDPAANPWGGPWSNLNTGMRTVQVNGMVYAYHRATGKLNWYTDCPNQMLVLEHFAEMPILLFTSRYQKPIKDGAMIRGAVQVTATRSIDKRTGKLVYDKENNNNNGQQQFYAVNTDPKAGTIELVSYNFKIQHYMDTSASGSRRGPRGGVEKTSEQPVQERGTRGAIILNARDKLKE